MVGAYQEILGNMHNLFGDTAAIDVYIDNSGEVRYLQSEEGDSVADMLHYVKLDPKMLLTLFRDQVNSKDLTKSLKEQFLAEFETGLYGYTYLEGESI